MRRIFILSFLLLTACIYGKAAYQPKDYSNLKGMPGFSDRLITMHLTLYQGYVKNANLLLDQLDAQGSNTAIYGAIKHRLGWELDGMRLHEYYFDNLGGNGKLTPNSPILAKINEDFGSFEAWKKDFIQTGMMRGIGWAILYLDPAKNRLMNLWINEHDLGHLAGGKPLLVVDVFEHAYMPQFGLERAEYIEACFSNMNWNIVNERFKKSSE